jgi:riboflavin transporter FmnP
VLYTVPQISYFTSIETRVTASDLLLGLLPITTIAVFSLIVLHFWGRYSKDVSPFVFANADALFIVVGLGIIVRGIAMVIANYYFAGPLFFQISPSDFMVAVPWYILFLWNAFQGVVEMALAWTLAFKFGFIERYMKW